MIRAVDTSDAPEICEIYNHYIENSTITFEEECVPSAKMEQRILKTTKILPWIVYCEGDLLLGYAYAAPWRVRSAYRYSVESTVYIHKDARGRGIGKKLYKALLEELGKRDTHSVIAGITLPNDASIRLHESLGFKKCAVFTEVGRKMENWLDVGYWERTVN
jgi:L-amino acid N-acyltransferase YncA